MENAEGAKKYTHTWCQKKPEIKCRLGFFLISSDLICDINVGDIVCGYKGLNSKKTEALWTSS